MRRLRNLLLIKFIELPDSNALDFFLQSFGSDDLMVISSVIAMMIFLKKAGTNT